MMDFDVKVNIMPYEVYKALNLPIVESLEGITQLDNTLVKIFNMVHNLYIYIASKT